MGDTRVFDADRGREALRNARRGENEIVMKKKTRRPTLGEREKKKRKEYSTRWESGARFGDFGFTKEQLGFGRGGGVALSHLGQHT